MLGATGKIILSGARIQLLTVTEGSYNVVGNLWDYGYAGSGEWLGAPYGSISNNQTLNGETISAIGYRDDTDSTGGALDYPQITLDGDLTGGAIDAYFYAIQFEDDSNFYLASNATRAYNSTYTATQWSWANNEAPARWDGTGSSTVKIHYL